jgi:hypothetical protein
LYLDSGSRATCRPGNEGKFAAGGAAQPAYIACREPIRPRFRPSERTGASNKDAPVSRRIQRTASIKSHIILDGLHHRHIRVQVSAHTMGEFSEALLKDCADATHQ